jgi:GMP synthase PP-ATPase subunit
MGVQKEVFSYITEIPASFSDFQPREFIYGVREWADATVGKKRRVALSVSGGVDSTLVAHILHPVLGDRLYLFFVNDGLRRIIGGREEYEVTADMFKGFHNFDVLKTADKLLPKLDGVSDGRRKREIMIEQYVQASNNYIGNVGAFFVADGTIRPDIETTRSGRQRQHNVGIPYGCSKLQPVASLYKPQVRKAAVEVGIPPEFAHKIPCPGPSMLLRVGGVFDKEKLQLAKEANDEVEQAVDKHFEKEWGKPYKYDEKTGVRTPFQFLSYTMDSGMIENEQLSRKVSDVAGSQVKCYINGTKAMMFDTSVERQREELYQMIAWLESGDMLDFEKINAMGDVIERSGFPRALYQVAKGKDDGFPVGIKVVESDDAMTARTMEIPLDYISEVGAKIAGYGAGRVGYERSRKPPATIELF